MKVMIKNLEDHGSDDDYDLGDYHNDADLSSIGPRLVQLCLKLLVPQILLGSFHLSLVFSLV